MALEYDFIVVGAGPAGCAVAARLSEDANVQVALLEAGPDRRGLLADNAAMGSVLLGPRKSSNNYGFVCEPDAGLNHRAAYHPIGRGLGGGSTINAVMYMRGNPKDYDDWAAQGNPGWNWDEVLPFFKKAENNQTFRNDPLHGTEGPMWVEELRTDNPFQEICLKACEEYGIQRNPDLNGPSQEGVRATQVFMKEGVRFGAGKAYIHPLLGVRSNFQLLCDTQCTRILFEGKKAVGVEIEQNGRKQILRCRKEVIVSGGSLLSAKLLQLSGVGDPEWLKPLGISVVQALPMVGKELQDHVDCIMCFHVPGDPNLLGLSPIGAKTLVQAWPKWKKHGRGMLATNYAEVTGFMSLSKDSVVPEIQYEFVFGLATEHGRDIYCKHGISVHVLPLRPKSRGTVRLASVDPKDDPLIQFNYFSDPQDLAQIVAGLKHLHAVMTTTPTFKPLVKADLRSPNCHTDQDWEQFARQVAGTNYHPVGSCRMAPNAEQGVVDARLKVHGLEGLRVIDSSIMPSIIGGNTMAPSIMIGEKGAQMIKEDWQKAEAQA